MAISFDLLWLRVPPIRYVSPPACENISSGSGSSGPIIVVEHPARFRVTGLRVVDCVLHWDELPGACEGACSAAICYNIYRAGDGVDIFEVVAECVHGTEFPVSDNACYRVSALTTEGESDLSDAVCVECADCGDTAQTPENLIWIPSEGFPGFDGSFSVAGDAGAFSLVTFPGQSKEYQAESVICNPEDAVGELIITVAYSLNATTVVPPDNQAQLDVWSEDIPFGTFRFFSVGPASISGTLVAVIPTTRGTTALFIKVSASSVPAGLVTFSGSISIT